MLRDLDSRRLPFSYQHGGATNVTAQLPHTVTVSPNHPVFFGIAQLGCVAAGARPVAKIIARLPALHRYVSLLIPRATCDVAYCRGSGSASQNTLSVSPLEPGPRLIQ